jgi:predicted lipoprotein with Yx(FWY)xxD motif
LQDPKKTIRHNNKKEGIMRQLRGAVAIFGGAVAAISAAGSGVAAAATYGAPTQRPSSTAITQSRPGQGSKLTTLHTTRTTVDGQTETILVNSRGLPLYYYRLDTAKKSLVSGTLARLWPPLVSASPTASGVHGKLTSLSGADGQQVTYDGHFLYTFIDDAPGQVTGQGIQNFFVATPDLRTIGAASMSTASVPAAQGRYGY